MLPINHSSLSSTPCFQESSDPACSLPAEVMLQIFSNLSSIELCQSCLVNRQWRQLASDKSLRNNFNLEDFFPSLKVFDKAAWQKHIDLPSFGLTMEDRSSVDKQTLIPGLRQLFSSLSVEGDAGITLLTIPKGLTPNIAINLPGAPKIDHACLKLREIRNIPVEHTYTIAISNNVLEGSRNLSLSAQTKFASQKHCELPTALELVTLLVVTYLSSKERLYKAQCNDNLMTFARCIESIGDYPLVVGGFSSEGFNIDLSPQFHINGLAGLSYEKYGIAGVVRNL